MKTIYTVRCALRLILVSSLVLGCESEAKKREPDCNLARESIAAKNIIQGIHGGAHEWMGDVPHYLEALDEWGTARISIESDSVRHTGDVYAVTIFKMTEILQTVRDIELEEIMGRGAIDQIVLTKTVLEKLSEEKKERLIQLEEQSEIDARNLENACAGELTVDKAEAEASVFTTEMQTTVLRWRKESEAAKKAHREGKFGLGKPEKKSAAPPPKPKEPYSDLPEVRLKKAPFSYEQKAMKLNGAALKLHQDKKFVEAAQGFEQAVRTNPGHLLARYNLSCALAQQNKADEAFRVLKSFRRVDCPGCVERLKRARVDSDWDPLRGDARFDEITGNLGQLGAGQ